MHHEITCEWKGGLEFNGLVQGHHLTLDSKHKDGTAPKGPTPKPLLLLAAAGCTGMDVIPMLEKMRVKVDGLSIDVVADGVDTDPKVYTSMKIIYTFRGKDIEVDRDKIERAVRLSEETYCGVSAMLRMAFPIATEIRFAA
jgi:putative redox protein